MQRISITNPQNIIDGTAKKYYFKLRNTGGPKGDKGDKGDTGATGPQGPQGDPCTVVVNSTATLEPGSNAYVTNTGSLSNAVLNFGIPKGDRGPQGAKGDKGDTGAQGETGPRGPQGERGTNATVYIGTTSTLNPGSQATVYNSGSDSNAVLNFGIPKGEKGDTGSQGPQGPTGQDGQNFTPTIVETLPATGDQSKLYLTPKNYTTGTATGNPITISLGEDAGQITSAQLDGDTYQQSYTGKNLLNFVKNTAALNNLTVAYNSSTGAIHVSGTPTANWANIGKTVDATLPAGSYILWVDNANPNYRINLRTVQNGTNVDYHTADGGSSVAFTASNAITSLYLYIDHNYDQVSVDWTFTAQLEKGSTATSYEPYVGGVPSPNPDYPQPIRTVTGLQTIRICGRNIYDKSKDLVGYALTGNGVETALGAWHISDYIPVVGGESYNVTGMTTPGGTARTCYYDSAKNLIEAVSQQTSPYTITPPSGSAYVRLSVYNIDSDRLQIELGSTAHDYEAYSGTDYPLDLGDIQLCKLGTYQDYIYKSGGKWYVHKEVEKIELDQNSGWQKLQYGANAYYSDNSIINSSRNLNNTVGILSPQFTGVSYDNRTVATSNIIFLDASGVTHGITVRNTSWETLSDFTTWITNNGIVCYAILATPTDIEITNSALIAQLEAIRTASLQASNTITNTAIGSNLAGDMELGYCEYDPTNRYDKWLWLDINNEYEQIGS